MELLNGDCLELMKDIPDNSVDMILCDLPYGTTSCKWDVVIPFKSLWEEYRRIIKRNRAIVLFGSEPFSSTLRCSNLQMYKYDWIWDKKCGLGFLDSKFRPLKQHEIISVFSYGGCANGSSLPMMYNPQGLVFATKQNSHGKSHILNSETKSSRNLNTKYTNYPRSILTYGRETGLHPTQKPVALLEYLIKTYTNEGDVVLDNCMGSGSTGVACVNTGRDFIGIELDEHYFQVALKRIKQEQQQQILLLWNYKN